MTNLLYHNEGHGRFRDVSKESGIGLYQGKGMSAVSATRTATAGWTSS